jgi:hypothetical protein
MENWNKTAVFHEQLASLHRFDAYSQRALLWYSYPSEKTGSEAIATVEVKDTDTWWRGDR